MANWSVRRGRPNPITDIRNAWEFIYINGELDSVRNTIGSARSGGLTLAIVLAMRALLTAGAVSYLFDHEWGLGKMMVPSFASGASSSKPYPRENLDINLPAAEEDGDQPDIQTTLHRLELAKISEQKDRLADRIRPLIESEKERLRKKFWNRQLTACPCVEYSVHLFIEVEDRYNTIFLPRIRCVKCHQCKRIGCFQGRILIKIGAPLPFTGYRRLQL